MNVSRKSSICIAAFAVFASGCQSQSSATPTEASAHVESESHDPAEQERGEDGESDVTIAMGNLSPEDRREAEAQKFCAVMETNLLGSMGTPLKLDVKGLSVFVCCAGCKSKAIKNADETLGAVARLKAENSINRE